ncbi:MAG: DUF938 domain-containing protein [Alphaproteobacteria bacterium]|nr:DUF938 domain-containing protein [Alphaproteobacteria bacterium]
MINNKKIDITSEDIINRHGSIILKSLQRIIPDQGILLEIASGNGDYALSFASHLKSLIWVPSNYESHYKNIIFERIKKAAILNLRLPIDIDIHQPRWPAQFFSSYYSHLMADFLMMDHEASQKIQFEKVEANLDAIVLINIVQKMSSALIKILMQGISHLLKDNGIVYFYGPLRLKGHHIAIENIVLDQALQTQNSDWGIKDFQEIITLANMYDLKLEKSYEHLDNSLSFVLRRASRRKSFIQEKGSHLYLRQKESNKFTSKT